ncbi:MAG: hypothetical protein RLY86_4079, partial [Pseudomonadota bacterium]
MDFKQLTDREYDALEEALMASARGRAFLRQRDQRIRILAQDDWRGLLSQLTEQVNRLAGAGPAMATGLPEIAGQNPHLRIMREELKQLSSYIEQTRMEIAQLRPM